MNAPTPQNEVLDELCSETGPKVSSILHVNQSKRSVILCSLCGKIQSSAHYSRHLRQTHKLDKDSIRVFTSRFKDRAHGKKCSRRGEDVKIYKCPNCPGFFKAIYKHLRRCPGSGYPETLPSIPTSNRDGPQISKISQTKREQSVFRTVISCSTCDEYQDSALYASHLRDDHNIDDTGIHIFTSRFKSPHRSGQRRWKYVGIYECPLRYTFTKNMERNRKELRATGSSSTDK